MYGSSVSMYSPMNNLKMPSVRKMHPCSEIEVYLLRMLFLARVTVRFCFVHSEWMCMVFSVAILPEVNLFKGCL